ncbi:hypothetical protein EK21DRAFT_103649 [Setomelanomma holmii]|uniref:Uncharacterized protein n=1 Tax=Setomelanomma holmii TaxID=210430 RepID=A0A9P4H230_9PLEO|nr:hypothetical protein EK21DRAFT_103649 [Setomelanomma holmii]
MNNFRGSVTNFLHLTLTTIIDHARWSVAIDFGTTFTTIAFKKGDWSAEMVLTVEGFLVIDIPVATELRDIQHDQYGTATPPMLYGYQITRKLEASEQMGNKSGIVTKAKLLLDESPQLRQLRKALTEVLKLLKKEKLIKKDEDVIELLLVCFLQHTKKILAHDYGFLEVTLAVPVCWSARAVAAMNGCLQAAMKTVQLGTGENNVPNIFIVNEAEAATTNALSVQHVELDRDETFVLLDCGGGTTDVGMYKIAHDLPFRLGEEVTHPKGAICGSSDLNERFRHFAVLHLDEQKGKLEDVETGITIHNIIESEMMHYFESDVKRAYDPNDVDGYHFRLRGLRKSTKNPRLQNGMFVISPADLQAIFQESLDKIDSLMLAQLKYVRTKHTVVKKVVLAGGFGDSPALQAYLRASLNTVNTQHGTKVELVVNPKTYSAPGVAVGGLVRAMNKENGPRRVPYRSIGIIYHVPDDLSYGCSAEEYFMRTLKWLIKVGEGELEPMHTITFESMHQFSPDDSRWIAREELYASDTCNEDYFTRSHKKNIGKTSKFGHVEFDVTHLKSRIELFDEEWYEVVLRIELLVIDRNLQFTAYWPANSENATAIQGSQTSFDMSTAFKPGTA